MPWLRSALNSRSFHVATRQSANQWRRRTRTQQLQWIRGALTRPYFDVAVCLYISQPILGLEQQQQKTFPGHNSLVRLFIHARCIIFIMGVNLNLSASLNIFKLLSNPSLCLPHAAVSTFRDLPIPLDSAFKRKGADVNIKAVVLDKDDCFAVPETNEIHKPYLVIYRSCLRYHNSDSS